MTATITEFRCPTCDQILGEREHILVIQKARERDAAISAAKDEDHRKEIQQMAENYERKVESEVSRRIREQATAIEMGYKHELVGYKRELGEKDKQHARELAMKDQQIEEARLESHRDVTEQIRRAVGEKERQRIVEETSHREHIKRLERDNMELSARIGDLTAKVEEQKKRLENANSKNRGTTGERVLRDDLEDAFPKDDLVQNMVGVEMADLIQTIVTENGERIAPPIVWERKTSDKITPKDIRQAQGYKTTHNTDYSIIVTDKGITTKDSDNMMFGMRDGIHLVHPMAVVEVAKLIRGFIIDKARQISSNKDRTSKQARLYDYLKSTEYARTIETMRNAKAKLDDMQRKEEEYHKKTWKDRKGFIDTWSEIIEQNQRKMDDVMHDPTSKDSEDDLNREEEDNSSS